MSNVNIRRAVENIRSSASEESVGRRGAVNHVNVLRPPLPPDRSRGGEAGTVVLLPTPPAGRSGTVPGRAGPGAGLDR